MTTTETTEAPVIDTEARYPVDGIVQRSTEPTVEDMPKIGNDAYILVTGADNNGDHAFAGKVVKVERTQSGWYRSPQRNNYGGAGYFHGSPLNETPNVGEEVLVIQPDNGQPWVKGKVIGADGDRLILNRLYGPEGHIEGVLTNPRMWVRIAVPLPDAFVPQAGDDEETLRAKREAGGLWLRWHSSVPLLVRESERRGWMGHLEGVAKKVGIDLPPMKYKVSVQVTVKIGVGNPTAPQLARVEEHVTNFNELRGREMFLHATGRLEFEVEAPNSDEAFGKITKAQVADKAYDRWGYGIQVDSFVQYGQPVIMVEF